MKHNTVNSAELKPCSAFINLSIHFNYSKNWWITYGLGKTGRGNTTIGRIAGSGVEHRSQVFSADKLLVFNDRRLKFNFFKKLVRNMLCLCAAQLKF